MPIAAYTSTPPGTSTPPEANYTSAAPGASAATGSRTTTPPTTAATLYSTGAAPTPLTPMPAIFQPAFVELTGAGNTLSTLNASTTDIGKIVQGTIGGRLHSYQVQAYSGAQVLPGIVLPANYDAVANAVAFVEEA